VKILKGLIWSQNIEVRDVKIATQTLLNYLAF